MDDRLKILPMVALGALVLLTVKIVDLWTGGGAALLSVATAEAGSEPDKKDKESHTEEDKNYGESKDDTYGDEGVSSDLDDATAFGQSEFAAIPDPALISESEVRVLESLAQRRAELDKREKEIALKISLLEATEKRVQNRIDELKGLETTVRGLLQQRDEEKEKQIASLVKVYETMKPKDAARIFEDLEQELLVDVAGRMREAKIAAVLAKMSPQKAQGLTVMMARRFASDPPPEDGEG